MSTGLQIRFDQIRELDFGDISGSYAALGLPTSKVVRILSFNNGTDADIYISFDGSTDNLLIKSNSFKLFDLTTNRSPTTGLFLSIGTQMYAKLESSAPTSGSVWLEMVYSR